MPLPQLTEEQLAAVCAGNSRIFIEAAPGAGKTTVAAERYGVLRFNRGDVPRGAIEAVSFTRSATFELRRRIVDRWGSTALAWPNGVQTIDSLVCEILEYLLRQGIVRWPGDHTELEVLDDWRGHRGYRWLNAGSFRRIATVTDSGHVDSRGVRMTEAGPGIGSRADFHGHLEMGRCTHEVVRSIVTAVLRSTTLREAVQRYLEQSVTHLVVDEVFDANPLDLAIVLLCCRANLAVTLVGDPWQALYGFRGARPDLVPGLTSDQGFERLQLSRSFRFQSEEMERLGENLRSRRSVVLTEGSDVDVLLASQWDELWQGPTNVLPLSFGRTTNKTDAAAIVLLDHLVHTHFERQAIFLPEALIILGLDADAYRTDGPEILASVIHTLRQPGSDSPRRALDELRLAMRTLGAPRRPPAGSATAEQRQLDRLAALSLRVRSSQPLLPGMTIHQAKGREWDRVGVTLSNSQISRLGDGLDQTVEADRAIYVALTRARHYVRLVA